MADSQAAVGRSCSSGKISEQRGEPSLAGISSHETRRSHSGRAACHVQRAGLRWSSQGSHAVYVSQPDAVAALSRRPPQARKRQRRGIGSSHKREQAESWSIPHYAPTISHSIPAPFQPLHLALSNGSRQTRICQCLIFLTRCQLRLVTSDGLPSVHRVSWVAG